MTALKDFEVQADTKAPRFVDDRLTRVNPTYSRENRSFCFHGDVTVVSPHDLEETQPMELEVSLREISPDTFPALLRRLKAESWISDEMIDDFQLRLRALAQESGFDLATSPQWPW